jgi:hypothetical protein
MPRRNGRIARLPKKVRDQVSELLQDGLSYQKVSEWLAKEGIEGIDDDCVGNWFHGGHQDWLQEQERLMELRATREFAFQMAAQTSGGSVQEAGLHLAASQLFEVFCDFDVKSLKEMLTDKPERYTILLNVFERLSKGTLDIEKYKANVAEQKKKIEDELTSAKKTGGLSEETIRKMEEALNLM